MTLLTSRFNIKKAAGEYSKIIRFGLASALYGIIFKLLRRLLARLRVWMSKNACITLNRDSEIFIACGLAAFALKASHPSDFGIFRVVLLSRTFIAVLNLISECGLFSCARPAAEETRRFTVETLMTMIATTYISYAYTYEWEAFTPSLEKMVYKSSNLSEAEAFSFTAIRSLIEMQKNHDHLLN